MLDSDLAELYGVVTWNVTRVVLRNPDRFPPDFAFTLSNQEVIVLSRHFGVSSSWGGRRNPPMAFTEEGVAMLSSVLRSKRAAAVNVAIMQTFVQLRRMIASHKDLAQQLAKLERKYDAQFRDVFEAIRQLMQPPPAHHKRRIGF